MRDYDNYGDGERESAQMVETEEDLPEEKLLLHRVRHRIKFSGRIGGGSGVLLFLHFQTVYYINLMTNNSQPFV